MKGRRIKPSALVGSTGLTELWYTGKNAGDSTWWGKETGQQYKAGGTRTRIFVDNRDVEDALSNWKERNTCVFVRAPKQKVQPVKLPPPAPEQQVIDRFKPPQDEFDDYTEDDEAVETFDYGQDDIDATAGALALAEEAGIDLVELYDGERITKRDVERFIADNFGDTGDI